MSLDALDLYSKSKFCEKSKTSFPAFLQNSKSVCNKIGMSLQIFDLMKLIAQLVFKGDNSMYVILQDIPLTLAYVRTFIDRFVSNFI